MTTSYLIPAINELKQNCKKEKGDYGDIYYRGNHGTAKIVADKKKYSVYFFEKGSLKADDQFHGFKTKREAEFFSLQCVVKGYV